MREIRVEEVSLLDQESTPIPSLEGVDLPAAFFLNYQDYGYGKFQIDDRSLIAYEKSVSKIALSLDRKAIMNMMYD